MLLEEIGAQFELVLVDRANAAAKSPEYLKLNPNGQIPVLVEGDLVVYEAAAICLYLADRYPHAKLVPPLQTPERAHFYQWLFWCTNTLQAMLMHYFYSERLVDEGDANAAAQVKIAPKRGPAPCSTGSTSNWPRTAATGCSARGSARSIRMR